jgi:crossover junction endodeoxyribonuclease RuvC
MKILGLDPGTATTGYAIIETKNDTLKLIDFCCITTEKTEAPAKRLNQIANDLTTLITNYKPDKASVEKLFFNTNIKTAISVAQARGVLLMTLEKNNINHSEFTPLQIKSAICGYGKADKKMVQNMVKIILNLKEIPKPDDAADAIAAAICLANTKVPQ